VQAEENNRLMNRESMVKNNEKEQKDENDKMVNS